MPPTKKAPVISPSAEKKSSITEHRKIAKAAELAIQLIQEDAAIALKNQKEEAALQLKVLAEAAAVALKTAGGSGNGNGGSMNLADHDALVTLIGSVANLDTRFTERFADLKTDLKADIKDIKDGTTSRIEILERTKLNTCDSYPVLYKEGVEKQLKDHETRIRFNETNITRIVTIGGALLILVGVIEFLINKFL